MGLNRPMRASSGSGGQVTKVGTWHVSPRSQAIRASGIIFSVNIICIRFIEVTRNRAIQAFNIRGCGLTGRRILMGVQTWACARGARSSPGFHVAGFQPCFCRTIACHCKPEFYALSKRHPP